MFPESRTLEHRSRKGGRQRLVIHETLKSPRTVVEGLFKVDHLEVLGINSEKGRRNRSMIQETLKVQRITIHKLFEDEFLEVLQVNTTETWVTPYKRYLSDGLLFTNRWEPFSSRLHSPDPHMCKRRSVCPHNGRAS